MKGNKLTIRNIPEDSEWRDKDIIAFHAVFTCLCNFIEEEHEGADKFEEYVEWCEQNETNRPDVQRKTLELYRWYMGKEWEGANLYPTKKGQLHAKKLPVDYLKEAVEVMGCWWT